MFPLRKYFPIFSILFLCLPGSVSVAKAESNEEETRSFSGPLPLRNDNPLYLTLFSTALPDRARTAKSHHWTWKAQYLGSNYIIEQHNVIESDRIVVDAETQRFEVDLAYALDDRLELSATLPYLVVGGGYMDDFIGSFEDTFGFVTPGARESRKANNFQYFFRVNREDLINKSDKTIHGLADIPIQIKYRFRNKADGWLPQVSLRGILKLPTATESLLGNDQLDGGIGLLAEQPIGSRAMVLTNLDVTSVHLPAALKTLDMSPVMVSGTVGIEYFLTQRASVQLQTTMASNPYPKFHKDMTALNVVPMGIGLGWTYRFSRRVMAKLTVVENLFSAWSDFSWGASLQTEF